MGPLVALAIFAAGAGLASREIEAYERAAANDVRSKLQGESVEVAVEVEPDGFGGAWGNLDRVTITASRFDVDGLPLFTEPWRSKAARCGELVLKLSDFRLKDLRVESLEARIPACRYDLGLARREKRFRVSRSGVGTGQVVVQDADLADFILRKYHEIKRVEVKAIGGRVFVRGYGEFLVFTTSFTVVGRLVPDGPRRLALAETEIHFGYQKADPTAAKTLLDTLNPVVEFDRDLGLMDAIDLQTVDARHGRIVATGRTRIPAAPGQSGGGRQER